MLLRDVQRTQLLSEALPVCVLAGLGEQDRGLGCCVPAALTLQLCLASESFQIYEGFLR